MAPASQRRRPSVLRSTVQAGLYSLAMTDIVEGKVAPSVAMQSDVNDVDKRYSGSDRRSRPTPMLSRYVLSGGRRRHVRRKTERDGAFVDVHGAFGLFVVLVIVALNLLDAYFTMLFLSHGGMELNPIVQWVIDSDWHPWPFILIKTVGIGIACVFLMMAKHFRPARFGLAFVLAGYTVLLGWHLILLQQLP